MSTTSCVRSDVRCSGKAMNRIGVYVDGYNYYYYARTVPGAKWMNLRRLASRVLTFPGESKIELLKVFAGRARNEHTSGSQDRQRALLDALDFHCGAQIILTDFRCRRAAGKTTWVEEGTDENLIRHLEEDACGDRLDAALVFSNDSDFREVIESVVHRGKEVYVVLPEWTTPSPHLVTAATGVLTYSADDLRQLQLPDPIPGTGTPRPPEWHPDWKG